VEKVTERKRRDKIAGAIMRAAALDGVSELLTVTADDGTRPIVVAFDHELVSDVLHRVSWTGGYANLFVVDLDVKTMDVASVMPPAASLDAGAAEVLRPGAVHGDATIGMLLTTVGTAEDGLTVQVRLPSNRADVGLVSERQAVPV